MKRRRSPFDLVGEVLPALRGDDGASSPRYDAPIATELTTTRPARPPSFESDVVVPLFQSIITALIAALAAGVGVLVWNWDIDVMPVAGIAVLAVTWLRRLGVADELLSVVETLTNRDVNRDGFVGRHPVTLLDPVDARKAAGELVASVGVESRKADLLAFLHRCYTTGTSERDHGVAASGPERSKYAECRDSLFALGLASWRSDKGSRAGWRLTVSEAEARRIIAAHVV